MEEITRIDPRSDSYSALMWDCITNAHRYTPQPGDRVMDLGAHFGIFSLYCAARGAMVNAYEPQSAAFAELRHTVEVAREIGQGCISAFQYAVWSKFETMTLSKKRGESTATASLVRPEGEPTESVHALEFDCILSVQPYWDCVKCDIEGAEHEILTTSKQLHRVNYLTVEIHNDILSSQQTREIYEVLRKSFPVVTTLPRKDQPEQAVAYFCRR